MESDEHRKFVIGKIHENKKRDVRLFTFETGINSDPGQYVFVWEPGVSERPISIMDGFSVNDFKLLVKKRGPLTGKLFEKKEGDPVLMRGPYGTHFFDFGRLTPGYQKALFVAGGYGMAPLTFMAQRSPFRTEDKKAIVGFGSSDDIVPEALDILRNHCGEVVVTTEDGSYGTKGRVTDLLDSIGPLENRVVYTCGPESMMREVVERSLKAGASPERIELSMERRMKCGKGICDSCEVNGIHICREGPVLNYETLQSSGGFPNYQRDKTGTRVPVD
jgi:dihydroorotate dehydrogenase electron transfer subunit